MVRNGAGAAMGEASYQLTAADFAEAYQAAYRAGMLSWRGALYTLVLALFLTLVMTLAAQGVWPGPWPSTILATALTVVTGLVVFVILNHHVFIPANAERLFRNMRGGQGEARLAWTDSGISATSPRGQVISIWSDFERHLETPRLLVLLPVPGNALYVIPKAALTDAALSDLRARLAGHGVPGAGQPPR